MGRKKDSKSQKKQFVNNLASKNSLLSSINISYFTGIIVLFIYFLVNFFSLPDITNHYISNEASWIFNLEVFTNIVLFGLIAYFGYNYMQSKSNHFDKYLVIIAFVGIVVIHLLAFNPAVDNGGDNGHYLYTAKSIVTYGKTLHITSPEMLPDSIVVGYPLLLSLVCFFFGFNILAFKIFTTCLSLASVFVFYLIMRKLVDKQMALILTILYGIHSYVVVFSSMIMTETPITFWGILTWYLLLKYKEAKSLNFKLVILLTISSAFAYLTRNIGVTILGAVSIFLFLDTNFIHNVFSKSKIKFNSLKFKKFYSYLFLIAILFFIIQLRNHYLVGSSDASIFVNSSWRKIFSNSFPLVVSVFSENLFAFSVIRWQPFPSLALKILVSVVMLTGLAYGVLKRKFSSIYILLFLIILMLVTPNDHNSLVISRYLVPLIPFLIFIFYEGAKILISKFGNIKKIALVFVVSLVFVSNSSGNGYLIQRSHIGQEYPPSLANYFDCAKWINKNLPSDVIVESRKNRIFFIFSESYSIGHVNGGTVYSSKFENKILQLVKEDKLGYLVLDSFSGASSRCYVPLIKKYPNIFKLIKVFGKNRPCYLFKVVNNVE